MRTIDAKGNYVYPDYYTKALQDVLSNLTNIKTDFRRHHMLQGMNNCIKTVECMLKNRMILRDDSGYFEQEKPFVRLNSDKEFEVYSSHHGLYNPDDYRFHCPHCNCVLKERNETCPECGGRL